ncbi:uncharacterized protein TM35_000391470 [Trypanosoma theileri]|uniref:Uncharacterized protein n=1 Tax=Trypanosoma theileri TaxID=67003 RepID=A0A1X0NKJ1_9TRYP|nr:uncharacterized protein TM35_000391470 [Trypanosoma theileri]ORC84973.1 hypothetical protein TM35_000391470 [Trypanosoma theileri]
MYAAARLWRSPVTNRMGRTVGVYDRRGRFSTDEAAAALQLDAAYTAALYRPLHYTFAVGGQHYPAEQGRVSRPGSRSCARGQMFPLYRRNRRLQAQLMELDRRTITTE